MKRAETTINIALKSAAYLGFIMNLLHSLLTTHYPKIYTACLLHFSPLQVNKGAIMNDDEGAAVNLIYPLVLGSFFFGPGFEFYLMDQNRILTLLTALVHNLPDR